MKLVISPIELKYEIEAVVKIFFPAERFDFLSEDDIRKGAFDKNIILVRKRSLGGKALLYAYADVDGKRARKVSSAAENSGERYCCEELSRLLYGVLNALTGIISEWGILTGVRPVKRVNAMIKEGLDKKEITDRLSGEYFVSAKKCALAFDTAASQERCLKECEDEKDISLYISIPFCPSRCSYCSFISQSAAGDTVKKLIPKYIEELCEEIKYTAQITQRLGLRPKTVYFGGGTPTTLSAAQLVRIMKTIAENFDISGVSEYTIESGRPDTVTAEKLQAIKENGCTRISVNPQTLDNSLLERIGRAHTVQQFYDAFELARTVGFETINTDIIAGLAGDSVEGFKKTVDGIIALRPNNITVHTLSIKRSSRINSSLEKNAALSQPAREMTDYASYALYEYGYKPYYLYRQKNMVDNLENIGWSEEGHESLYNIYIMEELQTIIALGAAASTKLVDRKNSRLKRVFNYKYPIDYDRNFRLMLDRKKEIENFYAEKE